jgi:hypothetical protein
MIKTSIGAVALFARILAAFASLLLHMQFVAFGRR